MNSPHIIEEARFEIAFSAEDEAFSQQESLSALVNGALLTEINNAFTECNDGQSVISIDELEVDLGTVSYQNYRHEMVERLRSRLREQLRDRLRGVKSDSYASNQGEINRLERHARELEALCCYLHYGHLPWYLQAKNEPEVRRLFMSVVETHRRSLVSWLATTQDRDAVLLRLAEILPFDGLWMVARQLLVHRFDAIRLRVELLTDYHFSHGWLKGIDRQGRVSCMRDLWRGVIAILLDNNGKFQNTAEITKALISRCGGGDRSLLENLRKFISEYMEGDNQNTLSSEPNADSSRDDEWTDNYATTLSRLISALDKNNTQNLQVVWGELLSAGSKIAGGVLRDIILIGECRRRVVDQFSEAMLYQWISVVDNDHTDQIKQCHALFMLIARREGISEVRAHQDFWDCTLRYSAYEAGSLDNAIYYLVVLLNELRYGLKDVVGVVGSLSVDGQFKTGGEVHVSIEETAREQARFESAREGDENRISAASISRWFERSDRQGLMKVVAQWSAVLEMHAALFDRLLRLHGRKSVIRQFFVHELSSHELGKLIGVVVPDMKDFVDGAVMLFNREQSSYESPDTIAPAGSRRRATFCDERDLWGFTFDFFFVERGSRFNRKEYCGSLLREMAAHNNCSYRELLAGMHQWLSSLSAQNRYADELLSIIDELGELAQLKSGDEKEHPLRAYAERLIAVVDQSLGFSSGEASWQRYRQFYHRNLAQGQHMPAKIFIRLLVDDLIEQAEGERLVHYAKIISRLRENGDRSQATAQMIAALSEVVERVEVKRDVERVAGSTAGNQAAASLAGGAAVYVTNAGQVLLAPYLPVLFERLGLTDQGLFIDHVASERAVHALQYMVDGVGGAPEYMMVLNKLICGIESARPVARAINLTDSEKSIIDGLLTAAIENWKGVGNTSVDGLRESFLRRDGRLKRKDGQWQLLVESRSYDMLLDQLPWSYSTIKYAWMHNVLHVEWR